MAQYDTSRLIDAIGSADDLEMTEIVQAVIRRYSKVFPSEEVVFLSLPREPIQRKKQLEIMLEKLRDHTLE